MNSWYIDRKSWHRYYRVSIIFSEVLSRGFARSFGDLDYQNIYSSPLIIRSSVFNICRTLFLPHKVELQIVKSAFRMQNFWERVYWNILYA